VEKSRFWKGRRPFPEEKTVVDEFLLRDSHAMGGKGKKKGGEERGMFSQGGQTDVPVIERESQGAEDRQRRLNFPSKWEKTKKKMAIKSAKDRVITKRPEKKEFR